MQRVSRDEAHARFAELVEAALQGEKVYIVDNDDTLLELVLVDTTRTRRQFGSARGLIAMADDFDAPLADFDEYQR